MQIMGLLDKLHDRSQDVYYGCRLDSEGVKKLKFPGLASINEKVGAVVCALYIAGGVSGMAMRGYPPEEYVDSIDLPNPRVRRAIGLGINAVAVTATAFFCQHNNIDPVGIVSDSITDLVYSTHGR